MHQLFLLKCRFLALSAYFHHNRGFSFTTATIQQLQLKMLGLKVSRDKGIKANFQTIK
jgi:hypothetical protein